MADNRKYYYLKLKESYFDEDAIVLLESMQDGMLYSNILLKMYLKSLKNGGKLQLAENIPYTAQMIATITRQQVGTVERALQIFMKLGLVEPLQNGALYMSNIELLIGQSSTEGGEETPCKAGFTGTESLAGSRGGQTSTRRGGHLSTRDRERDRYRVRDKERGRAKERTDSPRPFWQIQKRILVRKRACGAARGASRQMGVLH